MPLVKVNDVVDKKFDYVIIGGGTAGLTLAARLTEDPSTTVLVLEAGLANLQEDLLLRPFQLGAQFNNPKFDWSYKTVPQKYADGTEFGLHSGKGLGGSSGINFMCWTKPPKEDIDDLEKLGNPGWNWKTHEKYINRAERFAHVPKDVQALRGMDLDKWIAGVDGPLVTSHPKTMLDIELKAQDALRKLGFPDAKAPLSGDPNGVFFVPNTIDNKTFTRTYAMNAFFLPNHERPNFSVLVEANVNKLVFADEEAGDLVAKGVEFRHDGGTYTVEATKEVIVAAGSLKSPHILELSGIGRKEILDAINVPIKVELPGVGENYQEHTHVGISFEIPDNVVGDTWDLLFVPGMAAKHVELHAKGEGMFTQGVTALSFSPLSRITDKADAINHAVKTKIEQNMDTYPPGLQEQYKVQLQRIERGAPQMETIVTPGLLSFPNPPTPGKRYMTFINAVNHPFSRGTVHAVSSDPTVNPAYDPRYFEHEYDLESYVEIIKFSRKAAATNPLKDILGGEPKELNPGADVKTDEQIKSWVKKILGSTYHPLGTCSMLPREKEGVVDPKLKVYGTKNVRIVDLSIFPLHFAAHSQATVYGIAEQAADIIRGII